MSEPIEAINAEALRDLEVHVTDGGAIYLTDNHMFAEATIVIRLDGEGLTNLREVAKQNA